MTVSMILVKIIKYDNVKQEKKIQNLLYAISIKSIVKTFFEEWFQNRINKITI